MEIRILTNNLAGFFKGQVVDLSLYKGTPMESFWLNRLELNDGICEIVKPTDEEIGNE